MMLSIKKGAEAPFFMSINLIPRIHHVFQSQNYDRVME